MRPAAWMASLLMGANACTPDQGFAQILVENTVVISGDFDRLEEPLLRADVPNDVFDGYTVQPVYEDESGSVVDAVESLWTAQDEDGQLVLFSYDAMFVNSGARGLGAYVYNDVEADDQLVGDPDTVALVTDFASSRGRTLVVTDWAYDLVEAGWEDQITFLNEDDGLDAAQVGLNESIVATVTDDTLVASLGSNQLEVQFDFGYWTVIEDVANSVTVHMRGNVQYRKDDGSGTESLDDVPLLVSFESGTGTVVYSAFSWRAQRPEVADLLLSTLVTGINVRVTETSRNGGADHG